MEKERYVKVKTALEAKPKELTNLDQWLFWVVKNEVAAYLLYDL